MNKLWLVFSHEYARHVMRRRFIMVALSIPFSIAVVMTISILAATMGGDHRPIGYVDQSGLLAHPIQPAAVESDLFTKPVQILAYASEDLARGDLQGGKLQAYYVLSPDYIQTAKAKLVYQKAPNGQASQQFADFLRSNLLASQPAEISQRLIDGTNITIQSADGKREMSSQDWVMILVPILVAVMFLIIVMTSGGYLLQAVVEEKENRTMEVMVTSVSPTQMMTGKILGNIAVALTQLLIWILFIAIGLLIGRNQFEWIKAIQIQPSFLALAVAALLPSFILVAAIMAAIGTAVTESREAQQISGLFTLPVAVPLWLTYPIMTNPNGPLAVGLSFFPLTAPVTLMMRAGFTEVPPLQIALILLVLVAFAAGGIWIAARTFRLGMLSYGRRITWKQIFGKASAQ